jgi:hypothetical protein
MRRATDFTCENERSRGTDTPPEKIMRTGLQLALRNAQDKMSLCQRVGSVEVASRIQE